MGDFRMTARAESDLAEIADYTIKTFGIEQAHHYRDALPTDYSAMPVSISGALLLRERT